MSPNLRAHGQVHLNNGEPIDAELTVGQDVEMVSSRGSRPKPSWSHVDSNGHYHAADDDRKFPTLNERYEPAECDGSCGAWGGCDGEGYTKTVRTCRICGEEVEPDFVDVVDTIAVPGFIEWQVIAQDMAPIGGEVTVRFVHRGGTALGVGLVTEAQISSEGSTATIVGNGPLGWRKADKLPMPRKSPDCSCELLDTSVPGGPPSFIRGRPDGCPVHDDGSVKAAKRKARDAP